MNWAEHLGAHSRCACKHNSSFLVQRKVCLTMLAKLPKLVGNQLKLTSGLTINQWMWVTLPCRCAWNCTFCRTQILNIALIHLRVNPSLQSQSVPPTKVCWCYQSVLHLNRDVCIEFKYFFHKREEKNVKILFQRVRYCNLHSKSDLLRYVVPLCFMGMLS